MGVSNRGMSGYLCFTVFRLSLVLLLETLANQKETPQKRRTRAEGA